MKNNLNYIDFVQKLIADHDGLTSDASYQAPASPFSVMLLKASNSYAYLVDYRTGGYLSFSETFKNIANHPVSHLKKEGFRYYASLIHQQDWSIINESVFRAICDFLRGTSYKKEVQYRFIFNYRLQTADGTFLNIRQINNFRKFDQDGTPLINAGVCTLIPYPLPHFKITYLVQKLNAQEIWENEDVKTFIPGEAGTNTLSPTELKVLHWIKNGYSSDKIADKLNRSLHTIKTHRKNMLEKTSCRNTAELLQFSLVHGLF